MSVPSPALPPARTADVVVIGGGIMGLHVAWKLAAAKVGRVLLFEKKSFGAGESGKSGAILRQHYSHATLIRMARASLFEYAELHASTRGGIGFQQPGLIVFAHERERAMLAGNVALQRQHGVPTEVVDAKTLRELEPRAVVGDEIVGAFERDAAFVDPARAIPIVAARARAAGATLVEGARVVDVEVDAQRRVQGVALADGTRVAARTVVNAGGPWAAALCRRLGVELPLSAVRPQQAFFSPPEQQDERHVVLDLQHGAYWKTERRGITRLGLLSYDGDASVPDPDQYDETVAPEFVADARARIERRLPDYARTESLGGWGALYTVTPDAQAVIGRIAAISGLVVCSGFSGHGFKLGPSVGHGVTALLAGGDPGPLDPAFFAPDRFARAKNAPGAYGYSVLG